LSSRPANSEKYIVCANFKKAAHYTSILKDLREYIESCKLGTNKAFALPTCVQMPCTFLADIVRYNKVFITYQTCQIMQTLFAIDNLNETRQADMIKEQIRKAIKWCDKYNIQINLQALKSYQRLYKK
jgi:hypothetical protein